MAHPRQRGSAVPAVTELSVCGFRSIRDRIDLKILPLTILAGTNSSGKSSFIKPLLLVKQTIEAGYEVGALQLDGENVKLRMFSEALWQGKAKSARAIELVVRVATNAHSVESVFVAGDATVRVAETKLVRAKSVVRLTPTLSDLEIRTALGIGSEITTVGLDTVQRGPFISVRPSFVFSEKNARVPEQADYEAFIKAQQVESELEGIGSCIRHVIHLPALRGNPERFYPRTGVGSEFKGVFTPYVASVLEAWRQADDERLKKLWSDLVLLGLTWKVETQPLDDTRIELRVGRTRHPLQGGAKDLVNIADVGFGVSQALPLLVALRAAQPGQVVYVEQPEIHLHPVAQVALAAVLLDAVSRGVRVIAETHSELLILAILTRIAEGHAKSEHVVLHWFDRDEEGVTSVQSAMVDERGRFGDWPVDLGEVRQKLESEYLDAGLSRRRR